MPPVGVFISYRRIEVGWAGGLFRDLVRELGSPQVFMDINGGIPRGAKFDETLKAALDNCVALLAVIGPQWADCKRADGRRRLDVEDDWVRTEIATALKRDIHVFPVLVGEATLPETVPLPEDIQGLRRHQFAPLSDSRWPEDFAKLIDDLAKAASLPRLRTDITSAETGLRLLKNLATGRPDVAEAISRSKEVVETTQRQLAKLDLFKRIHDDLHTIESQCLWPMQAAGFRVTVRQYRAQFATAAARIEEAVQSDAINEALRVELSDRLADVKAAFQAAVATPTPETYQRVIDELVVLFAGIPSRLDEGMVNAAADLTFSRLVTLIVSVQKQLTVPAAQPDASMKPLLTAVDALARLSDELPRRVNEHTLLQSLDSKLRAVCGGGAATKLSAEWPRIKRIRDRLVVSSPEMAAASEDMLALEKEIDAAVAGDVSKALPLLHAYFQVIRSMFQTADQNLRAFLGRLSSVSQPLKEMLAVG